MKKIAFLSFDGDFEVVFPYFSGAEAYVGTRNDVQLVILSAPDLYGGRNPEVGPFDLLAPCDPREYDGLVIQGIQSIPADRRELLVDALRALGTPLIALDCDIDGACRVGTNEYEAMYGLVDEVLRRFGCVRPLYVERRSAAEELRARTQACERACAWHGLDKLRTYQAEEGEDVVHRIVTTPERFPDVIFCCDDDLAVGVQTALQRRGIRVPDDIRVTGFGDRATAHEVTPRITTVRCNRVAMGRLAMKTLVGFLDGETPWTTRRIIPVTYILAQSCGYPTSAELERSIMEELPATERVLRRFNRSLIRFQPALLNAASLSELFDIYESWAVELWCPHVYLAIDEAYLEGDTSRDSRPGGSESLIMAYRSLPDTWGAQGRWGMRAARSELVCDDDHVYARCPSAQLLPAEAMGDAPVYMVFPLRRGSVFMGSLVTEGVSPVLRYGLLTIVLALLAGAIETVHARELFRTNGTRLGDLYVHDQLTGLFNRAGLACYGEITYTHLLRDFGCAHFVFADVDNLKAINDDFGHELGDQALRDVAELIRRATEGENALALRYGGDEFLLICRRDLTPRLEQELQAFRESASRPYELELSVGAYCAVSDDACSLEDAIEQADARMYEAKRARKERLAD